jgi:hypothetical protein
MSFSKGFSSPNPSKKSLLASLYKNEGVKKSSPLERAGRKSEKFYSGTFSR